MRFCIIALGFLVTASAFTQTPTEIDYAYDESVLKGQGLPTKGPELLRVLRDRTPSPEVIDKFKKQVARMKAAAFAERVQATSDLVKMGPVVRPLLENLLLEANTDLETVRRLRHVLEHFPAETDFAVTTAAARLIRRDKPADSVKVLLEFVPYATTEYVRQDVQRALDAVGATQKKQLVDALKNESAARRAAAAETLIRGFDAEGKAEIEPLLKDAHPLVRYQLGMALVETRDKAGLPLLIGTLADSPTDRIEFALDLLYRVAGETAPTEPYPGPAAAKAFSAHWEKWYAKQHAALDLPKQLARTHLGLTVITCMALKVNTRNRIFEIGPDKAVRWEFDGPRYPLDVQIIGPNRLLLAEYFDRRVTERDFKGNVLKQFPAINPIACQRLANGHTFIVTRQQLQVVDGEGRDVFNWTAQPPTISAAQRLRNGQMVVVTSGGQCQLLDPKGQQLKTMNLGGTVYTLGGNVEVLANGRVLVPLYNLNSIAEFDWTGNKIWSANVNRPISVSRLPNGNTLVTCSIDYRVVELDKAGKEVWSYQTDGRPFRARKR